ncbi:crotonase/enoyl-CoA hydratase family protein [Paraconexibacter sp.]|uniref:crotonase/enoyl-CoA hydratase family protein n=1 Tax=Paraconexibacter sp. TaxID=2949640 RepID=UPI003561F467
MSEDRVRIDIADRVATVTMVRVDKHNALDEPMFRALHDATERLIADESVRAVVLRGEGKSFCSGLDVPSFYQEGAMPSDGLLEREPGQIANFAQRVATDWSAIPVPVIAALHGNVFGGGAQIALGADIRIAAPGTRMSIMEMKWGLIPDMGITQSLPRLVPVDVAKELTYTGRIVDGAEAKALGLVTRIEEDPHAAADALAREIASKSPDAVRRAKTLWEEAYVGGLSPADGLILETELQREIIMKPNQLAAVQAGFSGEPAQFADPTPSKVQTTAQAV